MAVALLRRRFVPVVLLLIFTLLLLRSWSPRHWGKSGGHDKGPDPNFLWRRIPDNYPIQVDRPLPRRPLFNLARTQARFAKETKEQKVVRKERQKAIRDTFKKSWDTYKRYAWLSDEVTPVTGQAKNTYGGWAASLIDTLDTLLILDFKSEFKSAVDAIDRHVSFEYTEAEEINVFETTIRYLGGLISAFDMSGDRRLLRKAQDAGDMLYKAFDTPNRLPVTHWDMHAAAKGHNQTASDRALLAEIGSLSMEFTRLSLLTGDPKYHDAVEHISELLAHVQMDTKLPGMWSVIVDAANQRFDITNDYSLGGMSDSMYEYLPKMIALLGDADTIYRDMYIRALETAKEHLLYRPMTPDQDDILFAGVAHTLTQTDDNSVKTRLETTGTHLTCFVGGMFALGGRYLQNHTHEGLGDRLTRGCVWAYEQMPSGVMPETFKLQACPSLAPCEWNEQIWRDNVATRGADQDVDEIIRREKLPKGFTKITDPRYDLRPEAIESVFVMWRLTGDEYWRERAWDMWQAIDGLTSTALANSAVPDVRVERGQESEKNDQMESFWMGETIKYFYLIYTDPNFMNLDDWVFNTEAHPFKRHKR